MITAATCLVAWTGSMAIGLAASVVVSALGPAFALAIPASVGWTLLAMRIGRRLERGRA